MQETFPQAYALVQQNITSSGSGQVLPSRLVAQYLNTCTPGVLDVKDLMAADRREFLQMAYYGLFGYLPEQAVLQKWEKWGSEGQDQWAYRKAVLDALLGNPEVSAKGLVIRNNIYADDDGEGHMKRSLKQRIWSVGYKFSRRLPLGVKIRLKKMALKLFVRG